MAHSSLATVSVPAHFSNYTKGRSTKIKSVTVHHMAGVNTAEGCGNIFAREGRNGSSHYGIGNDGKIAWYVDESNTAWTNSNWSSNCESVTIETSNSALGGDWPVSDAALSSLVKLVADIAKRNGLGNLVPGQNLTWHSMYTATTCPGNYLRSKMQYIADEANKINNTPAPAPQPTPAPTPAPQPTSGIAVGDKVTPKSYVDYNGVRLLKTRDFYFVNSINGNRAVLAADNVNGPIYCAMAVSNLNKVGGCTPAPAPAPAPSGAIGVGSRVTMSNWVDYNGTRLAKTRDFYYVSEINGNRAVLRADSVNGPVYAAVNVSNLRKV